MQNENNSLFCSECGKKIPLGRVCPHCSASVNNDDIFCQNCGKRIAEKQVPTSIMPLHDTGASRDDVVVQVNKNIEYNYSVKDEKRTWRNSILYIIGAVAIFGVVGACIWNYYSENQRTERKIALADSLEKARQDSVAQVRQMERAKQDSIYKAQQEELIFLENFYSKVNNLSWEDLEVYVRKNITKNALQELIDGYDYECPEENCLALWLFSYEAGADMGKLQESKIEHESDNTFLVTNIYEYNDYKVRLGIVKEEDSYKINTIENVSYEERKELSREINQYSRYVGKWRLRKTTDEGQKMLIEVTLKENHSGEVVSFHDRGNVADVLFYEEYPQCILVDGLLYMTKDGDINGRGVSTLRVGSDGLYSYDNIKFTRESK